MQHVNDQRFYRGRDRILGGVCSGLAEGFHLDPLVVRVLFVLLIFLQGVGIFLYVVLWLVMPERLDRPDLRRHRPRAVGKQHRTHQLGRRLAGGVDNDRDRAARAQPGT